MVSAPLLAMKLRLRHLPGIAVLLCGTLVAQEAPQSPPHVANWRNMDWGLVIEYLMYANRETLRDKGPESLLGKPDRIEHASGFIRFIYIEPGHMEIEIRKQGNRYHLARFHVPEPPALGPVPPEPHRAIHRFRIRHYKNIINSPPAEPVDFPPCKLDPDTA